MHTPYNQYGYKGFKMNSDKLNEKLKNNWKRMEFELLNNDGNFGNNRLLKNFDKFMMALFERENDKSQLEYAEKLYDIVLMNITKIFQIEHMGYPAYDLTNILGEPFFVIFAGKELGTIKLNINGIETQTLVVGNNVFTHSDKKKLYHFWTNFKAFIIHELVHLNDYKRVKKIPKSDLNNAKTYYNNPLEFNAYYLEISHRIYNTLEHDFDNIKDTILSDRKIFLEYVWEYINKLLPELKKNLSKDMLFKWNKRLYQLFDEMKKEFGKN